MGGPIALLMVVLPYVYSFAGWQGVVAIFPGWLLLWVIVRLPLNLDGTLILQLQSWTGLPAVGCWTRWASCIACRDMSSNCQDRSCSSPRPAAAFIRSSRCWPAPCFL